MATTLNPGRSSPGTGGYPLDAGHLDEAFASPGTARPPYAQLLDALAQLNLAVLRERVQTSAAAAGLTFGEGRPIVVDPVPRLIEAVEWEALEAEIAELSAL